MHVQKTAIVAKVGGPPVLRVGHEGIEVLLERIVVELLELVGVVEVGAERVLSGVVLAEDVGPELVGPPVCVPGAGASDVGRLLDGTLALGHDGVWCRVWWKRLFEGNKLRSPLLGCSGCISSGAFISTTNLASTFLACPPHLLAPSCLASREAPPHYRDFTQARSRTSRCCSSHHVSLVLLGALHQTLSSKASISVAATRNGMTTSIGMWAL